VEETTVMTDATAYAATSAAALINTEWSNVDDRSVNARVADEFDQYEIPWTFWAYGAPRFLTNLAILDRPYPRATAGTPTSWSWDASANTLRFAYSTSTPTGAVAPAAPTEVYVPALHFPAGYSVRAEGAVVASAANAGLLRLCNLPGARSVSVLIARRPGGRTGAPSDGVGSPPCSGNRRRPPPACAEPSGRLAARMLGPLTLGMTRARARSTLPRFTTRGRHDMDFYCLARGPGIRAGYPSTILIRGLSRSEAARLRGRAILILTATKFYALDGVRVGQRIAAIAARRVGQQYQIGLNTWYLTPNGQSRGVLKVRHGVIEEIGIADNRLTQPGRPARTFLDSFS
jgi:hypothetical protein